MKFILLVGDGAVGKMTVGQELMKVTDLRLFHNHMTIEPCIEIFGYYDYKIINRLRLIIFEEFAKSENYGMIFTCMWAFDCKEDWEFIETIIRIFEPYGTEFYCVELIASRETRLARNVTENRLKNKASKRNIEDSNRRLIKDDENWRFESYEGELPFENYVKINNTNLSPEVVAEMIKEKFDL